MSTPPLSGDAWSAFLSADTSRTRLLWVLGELKTAQDVRAFPRAAHVLMLLGRPRLAADLLADRTDALSVGQLRLALVQRYQRTGDISFLSALLDANPHLGVARSAADREGQVRAYLAHGMALGLSGDQRGAQASLNLALQIALMEGLAALAQNIEHSLATALTESGQTDALLRFLLAGRGKLSPILLSWLRTDVRQSFLAGDEYAAIEKLVGDLGDDAADVAWWASSARTVLLDTPPPDLAVDPADVLLQLSHGFWNLRRAARAREQLWHAEREHYAQAALMAVAPGPSLRLRALRTVAYVYAGRTALAVRELPVDVSTATPQEILYLTVAAVLVLTEGGTYPKTWLPGAWISAFVDACAALPEYTVAEISARLVGIAPSAVLALSALGGVPDTLLESILGGQAAVLHDHGLHVGQVRHPYPGGTGVQDVRRALIAPLAERAVVADRVALHRHRRSVTDLGLPVAVRDLAERAVSVMRRDLPRSGSVRSGV